ncbi:cobalt transporter subunit [Kaistia algarum]|uniref:CbtB domain-containing protein n=1 Tax=Kaistia algarum TaxID=2083279 RepID=UPI000CE7E301|nr:CbtB domain-containing protein [Kaistia algarum]MCX5514890.1 CbtB-domain containing protein [Kaistia algarum]PPE79641.1 cobalt transporter subunit [Kaistia algarum]
MTDSRSTTLPTSGTRTEAPSRLAAGIAAMVFGVLLFVGTGFAAPSAIHNATHDTRHALGLPCH